MSIASNVLPMPEQQIVAYNEFRAQLAELKATNEKTVFQYADPKGNKAARSYVHKLRLTKGEVERVRKQEKAASLEYGRKVDAGAKEIIEEIEAMISVHERPLLEIENKEKERVAAIRARIDKIKAFQECNGHDSEETAHVLQKLRAVKLDESFAEFLAEATQEIEKAILAQETQQAIAVEREAQAAELARLQKAEAERRQKERDEAIAREATEKAEAAAREAAERAKEEARKKALQAEAAANAKIAAAEAEARRAQEAAALAVQQERDRAEAEQRAVAEEAERREADKKHRAKINREILVALVGAGISEEVAKTVITVIAKGSVPNVKIVY